MRTVIEETVAGHKLTVIQCIAPGVGFWYNGNIDGQFFISTGSWGDDKNTADDCFDALLKKLHELVTDEKQK